MELPHGFPFRWLDRIGPDSVRVELSGNSFWLRGEGALPPPFCAEIVAQAAAALLGEPDGAPRRRWLAGIDLLEVVRPLRAGERLEVRVRPEARFGGIVKVAGEIFAPTAGSGTPERVAAAKLLLA
jgi:hypothetical protein